MGKKQNNCLFYDIDPVRIISENDLAYTVYDGSLWEGVIQLPICLYFSKQTFTIDVVNGGYRPLTFR